MRIYVRKRTDENISTSKKVEDQIYQMWLETDSFKPTDNESNETFTVMIPPPNVTGILHIGHVLNNTIQDVLIRRARMQGKKTLWLPGTDHASIATEAKVTRMLSDKGIDKKDISREEFYHMHGHGKKNMVVLY